MTGEVISKLGGIKGLIIFASVFILGLFLVLLPQREGEDVKSGSYFDLGEYVSDTEKRLCDIISAVSGTGSVRVMVTLESSPEQYYQRDFRQKSNVGEASESFESEETLVYEERRPILVKEIYPRIKGVAVVCDGASNPRIAEKVIGIVACAMNVSANRIYVTN